ncbi:hypothetical protein [Shewanella sp. SM23]|uniref:hypothetical protein n=1 Tax=Shewanella sp. SM23 TaxID=2912794 RepID=UPI0021D928EF|nr:hypothetical protein [Shewanella sp. SM23]MCU8085466.1 hypothetical protein [Shewanella sp. SM23]
MPSRTTFLDNFNTCILCKVKSAREGSKSCTCDNYIGDAELLILALSSNGFCLSDLYKHITGSKDFMEVFDYRFDYKEFFDPYVAATDFIINAAKYYKDIDRVIVYSKTLSFSTPVRHTKMLPVLFEYLRDMIQNGGKKVYFVTEYGSQMLQTIVILTLETDITKFEHTAKSVKDVNFQTYNIAIHIRDSIYRSKNSFLSAETFKNAFVEIIPQVTCNDFSVPVKNAQAMADMFCYTRGLLKGKKPLNYESTKLIENYAKSYIYYNTNRETIFNPKIRDEAEYAVLAEI